MRHAPLPTQLQSPFALQAPFDAAGNVLPEIRRIFGVMDTPLSEYPDIDELIAKSDGWNSGLVAKLRQDMEHIGQDQKGQLWPLFDATTFIQPWYIRGRKKNTAAVGGCTAKPFLRRLRDLDDYLAGGMEINGVVTEPAKVDRVVLLGSDRPTTTVNKNGTPGADAFQHLFVRDARNTPALKPAWVPPRNYQYEIETDMMRLAWDSSSFRSPFLRDTEPIIIDARRRDGDKNKFAGSEEQVLDFLDLVPNPGDTAFFFNQPHCNFGHLIWATALLGMPGATLETAGNSADYGPGTVIDILGGITRFFRRYREAQMALAKIGQTA